MTGFARASRREDGCSLAWELRSVNGKGLDIRLRLPPGWDWIEPVARQAIGRRFSRGSIQATLAVSRESRAAADPVLNEVLLFELAGLAQRLVQQFGAQPAHADGLLALPGVLRMPEEGGNGEAEAQGGRMAVLLLDEALSSLQASRTAEGEALRKLLLKQVDSIEAITLRAQADRSREPAVIRERLAAQLRLLLEAQVGMDEGRLAAEAALLAVRADIREEIDRLKTHCAGARSLLAKGEPAGRRLDFLGQELNREANTLCSKSNAPALTAAGLELKAVVDQFREQVQNLE